MAANITLKDKQFKPYLSAEEIRQSAAQLGAQLSKDYEGKHPLFVCVLNGSFIFAADLLRYFNGACDIAFVKLKSYSGMQSSGQLQVVLDIQENMSGRDVVIIEDIVDTGHTLSKFLPIMQTRNPASLKVVSLLVKPDALQGRVVVDYVGMNIPNDFIVGYGLDYDGEGRHLPDIYVVC